MALYSGEGESEMYVCVKFHMTKVVYKVNRLRCYSLSRVGVRTAPLQAALEGRRRLLFILSFNDKSLPL